MQFNTDCQYWRGDKPCKENRLCEGCEAYEKLGLRILLIKVGARGDVLRTTPLVAGLKRKYPQAHLTWLTAPESEELLRDLPGRPCISCTVRMSAAGVRPGSPVLNTPWRRARR